MGELVAIDLPGGPGFVEALERVWDAGDAALPLDQRLPAAGRERLAARMGAGAAVGPGGRSALAGGRPVEEGDAVVIATSGSSGEPKGVVLTHAALDASAAASSARLAVTAADHWLACLPLSHVGGFAVITRARWAGTGLTVLPGFDAATVDASEATLVSLVATALRRVDAGRWRRILLGGAPPPDGLPPNVVTTYGMTETGSGVVYDGRPLDGVEVRIATGGEIEVRGPMLLRCYRDGRDPRRAGGWFPTGDLGGFDAAGRLHVHGRRSDLIITGGENVWPEPVERVLRGHPGVADVVVAGEPDDEWGQVVSAHVVPRDPAQPPALAELRDLVKAELPAFCAPRQLVLVHEVPRTSLGKPIRGTPIRKPGGGPDAGR